MVESSLQLGPSELNRHLGNIDGYLPAIESVPSISILLEMFTDAASALSTATTGHPPGSLLLLWALKSLPFGDSLLPVLYAGATAVLIQPFPILTPWAMWMVVGPDAVTAVLCVAARSSRRTTHGGTAAIRAVATGLLLATAPPFAYLAARFGLSIVCLYFARRHPRHNLATGIGALMPLAAIQTGLRLGRRSRCRLHRVSRTH